MAVNSRLLWVELSKRDINREDIKKVANITSNVITRIEKNNYVSLESLEKICLALDCQLSDII